MYEFPPVPWYLSDWWPTVIRCVEALAGIAAMAALNWKSRMPRFYDVPVMALICIGVTALLFVLPSWSPWDNSSIGQILLFCLIVWISLLVCGVVGWTRLQSQKGGGNLDVSLCITVLIVGFAFSSAISFRVVPLEAARLSACKNNLKHLGLALHNYHDIFESLPEHSAGDPPHSWRVSILPFIDQEPLYQTYNMQERWNAGANIPIARLSLYTFNCPSVPDRRQPMEFPRSDYLAVVGDETMWADQSAVKIRDVADGTSNTIVVVEACGTNIPWAEPRDLKFSDEAIGVNLPGKESGLSDGVASSYHHGGAQILLGDGSVRLLSNEFSPEVLRALLTKAGGEDVGEF